MTNVMSLNEINKLKINPGAKSSRFVVDLKRDLVEKEVKDVKIQKSATLEEKLEKMAVADYGKMIKRGQERSGVLMNDFGTALKNFWIPAGVYPDRSVGAGMTKGLAGMTIKKKARNDSLFNQLAFVQVGKLLFSLFYKICYAVGWLIMFALRLIYFILLAITKPLKKIFYFLFIKLQLAVNKIFKEIPIGYQASQAVAVSVFVRLLGSLKNTTPPAPPYQGGANLPYPPFAGGLKSLLKPVLVFAGVLLLIVLPVKAFTFYRSLDEIKGKVLGASESALANLLNAGKAAANFDFNRADQNFARASDNFLSAQSELNEINGLIFSLASVLPDKNMQLAAASRHILKAGELSAEAGKNLSLAAASIFNQNQQTINQIIDDLSLYGRNGLNDLQALNKELEQIDSDALPEEYQQDFILLKQKIGELTNGLKEFIGLADNFKIFLGANAAKRYLLVFQNNSELRASGGFIGSYAIIDFSQAQIKNIEAPGGGSYDTEAGLLKKIKAPEPLSLVRPDWHFWDANWWPDWPTSARKLAWFYENSGGSTVDGVISLTPTVMERLLEIIGPIDLKEKYGLIFDADNFWLETQKLAEQKPDVTKQPKKIIGDLMNKIIEELPKRLSPNNLSQLFNIFEQSLNDKNILFYFADGRLQSQAAELDWDGKIKATAGDYLNVVNTNIAGGKSDREIKQEIIHTAEVQPDGTIIDNLTIRRLHQAIKRKPFVGVRNVNWLRIYVPPGSELLAATGFKPVDQIFFKPAEADWLDDPDVALAQSGARTDEISQTKIYNELGKTVFANWSQVDPGETAVINIKYRLPFKLTDQPTANNQSLADQLIGQAVAILGSNLKNIYSYSLLLQKQPGMNSSTVISELKLSGSFKALWQYPADLAVNQSGWFRTENLEQDKLMAVIIEEQ